MDSEKKKAHLKEYHAKYYRDHAELLKEKQRKYRKEHREQHSEVNKRWNALNKEKKNAMTVRWQKENIEYFRKYQRERVKKRRKEPKRHLSDSISMGICQSFKRGIKAGRHWESLVGYTATKLKKHLEKQFKPGMNWDNYGPVWHIDHKIPIATFNFETPEDMDFKKCWSLKNLQPMWAADNIRKHARLDKPFQPSLTI